MMIEVYIESMGVLIVIGFDKFLIPVILLRILL